MPVPHGRLAVAAAAVRRPGHLLLGRGSGSAVRRHHHQPAAGDRRSAMSGCAPCPRQATQALGPSSSSGNCLRLPAEGPCECDLYLSCQVPRHPRARPMAAGPAGGRTAAAAPLAMPRFIPLIKAERARLASSAPRGAATGGAAPCRRRVGAAQECRSLTVPHRITSAGRSARTRFRS